MATFIYRNGVAVDKATGDPMLTDAQRAKRPQAPMVREFKPYACPITGKDITDPGMHRANLKKHNCVEAKEFGGSLNGEIKNHRFAKKHNLKVSDKYLDNPSQAKGI